MKAVNIYYLLLITLYIQAGYTTDPGHHDTDVVNNTIINTTNDGHMPKFIDRYLAKNIVIKFKLLKHCKKPLSKPCLLDALQNQQKYLLDTNSGNYNTLFIGLTSRTYYEYNKLIEMHKLQSYLNLEHTRKIYRMLFSYGK